MTTDSVSLYEQEYLDMVAGRRRYFVTPPDALVRAVCVEGIFAQPGSQVLDFGCGEGRNAEYLLNQGWTVAGTDVSQGAIAATDKRLGERVELKLIPPGGALPFETGRFDLVVGWEVMHWLGDKSLFLSTIDEFHRVTKPGARLVFTLPSERHFLRYTSVETGESQFTVTATSRRGTKFYAPFRETVKALCAEHGFTMDRVMLYEYGDEKGENSLEYRFSMYVFIATRT